MSYRALCVVVAVLLCSRSGLAQRHHEELPGDPAEDLVSAFDVRCQNGEAAGFSCGRVDLLAFLPLAEVGSTGARANDLWGFTEAGREFVLLGLGDGTAFVEITNPTAPIYLGKLPTHSVPSAWRDVKVFKHHAFIVSEAPRHGLQIFDLSELLEIKAPPVELETAAHYNGERLSNAHNVAINEDSGFAYIVGSNTCAGGLLRRVPTR